MLIRNAEIGGYLSAGAAPVDVRIAYDGTGQGRISGIGRLEPEAGEPQIDARGAALLPGLHDHHVHLFATAAARSSVFCGPPKVSTAEDLVRALADIPGTGWLRGIGYHEGVAGDLDRGWLDRHGPDRPVRIQHRGGRRWVLNTRALDELLRGQANGPDRLDAGCGHLDDSDDWLRDRLAGTLPCLGAISAELAAFGVTGVTEMTPSNDSVALDYFAAQQSCGRLQQKLVAAMRSEFTPEEGRADGRYSKFHLHEARLPDFAQFVRAIEASHDRARPIAVHCVTVVELIFTLAALGQAGVLPGDRIEHASVTPDAQLAEIAALGLLVVTQPNFVRERGDAYLADVSSDEQPFLYRGRSFIEAGIPLAAGTDAPFGQLDPWLAMQAAVDRTTASGAAIGSGECLTPEQALCLFLGAGHNPAVQRTLTVGAPADLCLLHANWAAARGNLHAKLVRQTFRDGRLIYESADVGR